MDIRVRRLLREAISWNIEAANRVCSWGDLDLLKEIDKKVVWPEESCANAAAGGHLEILIWLRDKGCPWKRLRKDRKSTRLNSSHT